MAKKYGETAQTKNKGGSAVDCSVNLNTANVDELLKIPGISKRRAEAIVDYRDEHGPFRSLDDIRNISGFSESMLDVMNQCEISLE